MFADAFRALRKHSDRTSSIINSLSYFSPFLQVLNDGFSRFDKNQMTSAIDFYQQQFIRSDLAVRKGGVFGIRTGADDHNEEHNRIMYTAGTLLPPFVDADRIMHTAGTLLPPFVDANRIMHTAGTLLPPFTDA